MISIPFALLQDLPDVWSRQAERRAHRTTTHGSTSRFATTYPDCQGAGKRSKSVVRPMGLFGPHFVTNLLFFCSYPTSVGTANTDAHPFIFNGIAPCLCNWGSVFVTSAIFLFRFAMALSASRSFSASSV
jgi:hypothetical protein